MNNNHMKLLIDILLDKNARLDERDDAAIDLANYPTEEVLNALICVASDASEKYLWDVAGESIGAIMHITGTVNGDVVNSLMPAGECLFNCVSLLTTRFLFYL